MDHTSGSTRSSDLSFTPGGAALAHAAVGYELDPDFQDVAETRPQQPNGAFSDSSEGERSRFESATSFP